MLHLAAHQPRMLFHTAWKARTAQKEAEARERMRDRDHHNRQIELSELEPISQERFLQAPYDTSTSYTLETIRHSNRLPPSTHYTSALTLDYRWSTPHLISALDPEGAATRGAMEREAEREAETEAETLIAILHAGVGAPRADEDQKQSGGNAGHMATGRVKGITNVEGKPPHRTPQAHTKSMYNVQLPCQPSPPKYANHAAHIVYNTKHNDTPPHELFTVTNVWSISHRA